MLRKIDLKVGNRYKIIEEIEAESDSGPHTTFFDVGEEIQILEFKDDAVMIRDIYPVHQNDDNNFWVLTEELLNSIESI